MADDEIAATKAAESVVAETTEPELPVEEPQHVPKPDKAAHDAAIATINKTIEELEAKRETLKHRIDNVKKASDGVQAKVQEKRAAFQAAREEQQKIKAARQHLLDARDAAREAQQKAVDIAKSAKRATPYASVDAIDARLSALSLRQSTESMSLAAERDLVREIETLKTQRANLAKANDALARAEAEATAAKTQGKDVNEKIQKLGEELKASNERLNKAYEELKALDEQRGSGRGQMPELIKERDELRTQVNAQYEQLRKLNDEFRTASRAHGAYVAAHKRWKAVQAAKDRAARGEEGAGAMPEDAAGEAIGEDDLESGAHPYAREQALCDMLVRYLGTLLPKEDVSAKEAAERAAREAANQEKISAFAKGLKEKVKAKTDIQDEFAGLTGKKDKKGKKAAAPAAAEEKDTGASVSAHLPPFGLDALTAFRLLAIDPPVTVEDLTGKIGEVRTKRAYYDTAPPPPKAAAPAVTSSEGETGDDRPARGVAGRGRGRGRGGYSSRGGRGGAAAAEASAQ